MVIDPYLPNRLSENIEANANVEEFLNVGKRIKTGLLALK